MNLTRSCNTSIQLFLPLKHEQLQMAMATSLYKAQEALNTCDEHESKELSFFCKTCKRFICITCGQTSHHGHVWDLISSVAKERRVETPKLCRKMKKENLSACREKLRSVKFVQRNREEVKTKLEERRRIIIDLVNRVIDEEKEKCDGLEEESKSRDFEKKLEYVEKMTTCLDSNIAAYNDFDLLEMEQGMLSALEEVESFSVDTSSAFTYVPGKINEELIRGLIGSIEETETKVNHSASVYEIKTIHQFKDYIRTIAPLSDTQAWIGDNMYTEIKLLSPQSKDINCMQIPSSDFIALTYGDFIVTHSPDQVIRRVTSSGKVSDIMSTKPLHPEWISKTQRSL